MRHNRVSRKLQSKLYTTFGKHAFIAYFYTDLHENIEAQSEIFHFRHIDV